METYKLWLILTEQDIRKVSLDGKPAVEELKINIKEKCKLQYDSNIMYGHPDFDNVLCNLDNIGDLTAKRTTVKVIPLLETASTTSVSEASIASDDTKILSTHTSSSSTRQERWPEFFDIPNFLVDVEYRLRQANLACLQDQTYLNAPRDMKHSSLEKLAEMIYKFDAYPNEEQIHSVAVALISKHPFLKKSGSPDGVLAGRMAWNSKLSH